MTIERKGKTVAMTVRLGSEYAAIELFELMKGSHKSNPAKGLAHALGAVVTIKESDEGES